MLDRVVRSVVALALVLGFMAAPMGVADVLAATNEASPGRQLPVDTAITTEAEVVVKGETVPYRATVGTQPVYGNDGSVIASLLYTYYERSDVTDRTRRPLVISFNGGPGSGSLWMHIGYMGPRRLNLDDEGYPVQPYGMRDNPYSIIDVADVVFVNPVNTGFSRAMDGVDTSQFFGINEDINYLADWVDNFVSRNDRWESPKYLIGESYGTARVAGLAGRLQGSHWMYLNGVILVSPVDLGIARSGPVGDALTLPYMAATAWYHDKLSDDLQALDLDDLLEEVENYTVEKYIPALSHGGFLEENRKRQVAQEVARYAGLSEQVVLDWNLAIPTSFFWKELLRDEGFTTGRLDSRYKGIDHKNAGDSYDYAAELTAWNHAFSPAINKYLRNELGFETDLEYWLFGPVHPWNRSGDTTGQDLRRAMAENPFLNVMFQVGYYDGATDYFSAKYSMWHLDPAGRFQDRLRFEGYRSGHMMYLREEDIETSNEHLREFFEETIPAVGEPAMY